MTEKLTSAAGAKPNADSAKFEKPPKPDVLKPASPNILRNSSSGLMLLWKLSKPPVNYNMDSDDAVF